MSNYKKDIPIIVEDVNLNFRNTMYSDETAYDIMVRRDRIKVGELIIGKGRSYVILTMQDNVIPFNIMDDIFYDYTKDGIREWRDYDAIQALADTVPPYYRSNIDEILSECGLDTYDTLDLVIALEMKSQKQNYLVRSR